MKRMWSKNELKSIIQNQATSGDLKNVKVFEEIIDKDGHKRFIEGNGSPEEISGITSTYCKWSLSGTHLMCVYAGTIADETVVADESSLVSFNLPSWIANKIVPVWSTAIERASIKCYSDSWSSQTLEVVFSKPTTNTLTIRVVAGGLTLTDERHFRMQFDLLIDDQ